MILNGKHNVHITDEISGRTIGFLAKGENQQGRLLGNLKDEYQSETAMIDGYVSEGINSSATCEVYLDTTQLAIRLTPIRMW